MEKQSARYSIWKLVKVDYKRKRKSEPWIRIMPIYVGFYAQDFSDVSFFKFLIVSFRYCDKDSLFALWLSFSLFFLNFWGYVLHNHEKRSFVDEADGAAPSAMDLETEGEDTAPLADYRVIFINRVQPPVPKFVNNYISTAKYRYDTAGSICSFDCYPFFAVFFDLFRCFSSSSLEDGRMYFF